MAIQYYSFILLNWHRMEQYDELLSGFDHNGPGLKNKLFGLPFTPENAHVVILPIPWEATVSYITGTARGPKAILKASSQIDLYHYEIKDVWKLGVAMMPVSEKIFEENTIIRALAASHIASLQNNSVTEANQLLTAKVNEATEALNIYVKNTCLQLLKEEKIVGVLGGDHSTPLGLMRALAERHDRFGILQIDAHADLRKSYEGFVYSHGSIMFNALKLPAVSKLVQVGIRDFCEEEFNVLQRAGKRVKTFFDADIKSAAYSGKNWSLTCQEIINELPDLVYISFDIDGLDPKYCPHTGTPVPGGFELDQITYLIKSISKSGRKIIGFDLCEVASGEDEWDANVGARALWELCHWTGVSHGRLSTN